MPLIGAPAPIAGLLERRARVGVGPPLLPRDASIGLRGLATVPVRSELTQPLLPSVAPMRLFPCEVTALLTLGPELAEFPATMESPIVRVYPLPLLSMAPPLPLPPVPA